MSTKQNRLSPSNAGKLVNMVQNLRAVRKLKIKFSSVELNTKYSADVEAVLLD